MDIMRVIIIDLIKTSFSSTIYTFLGSIEWGRIGVKGHHWFPVFICGTRKGSGTQNAILVVLTLSPHGCMTYSSFVMFISIRNQQSPTIGTWRCPKVETTDTRQFLWTLLHLFTFFLLLFITGPIHVAIGTWHGWKSRNSTRGGMDGRFHQTHTGPRLLSNGFWTRCWWTVQIKSITTNFRSRILFLVTTKNGNCKWNGRTTTQIVSKRIALNMNLSWYLLLVGKSWCG